jgi:hypothetical protein
MPIEIRELVIRATVEPVEKEKRPSGEAPEHARDELVAECVQQVLEILRQKSER